MTNNKLRVYGCGGAGINQASYFIGGEASTGRANFDIALIDTSSSNLKADIPEEHIYLLSGVDGSGKKRSENHSEIANTVKDVLVKHKPGTLNIVVFSASGGSGSVYGPLLLRELLERGEPSIGVVIGTNGTAIEAQNTVNTLKSMDNISRKMSKPMTIIYEQNSRTFPRAQVNTAVRTSILTLASLVGTLGNESGLDTSDLYNWLFYNNVTDVAPQLSLLEIVTSQDLADTINDPISVASILPDGSDATVVMTPDYGCEGFRPLTGDDVQEIHFVIAISAVPEMYEQAANMSEHYSEVKASRPTQVSLSGKNDQVTDDGLIL